MGWKKSVRVALLRLYTGRCWLWFCICQIIIFLPLIIVVTIDYDHLKRNGTSVTIFCIETALVCSVALEILFRIVLFKRKVLKSKFFIFDVV